MPSKSAAAEGKTPTTITIDARLLKRFRTRATEVLDEHRISKQVEIAMSYWLDREEVVEPNARRTTKHRAEASDLEEQEAVEVFLNIYRNPRNRLESSIRELVRHATEMRKAGKG